MLQALIGLLLLIATAPAALAAASATRPNILWISAEDLSPDLRCYGDDYSVSPNLDRLAGQGVRFTRAFATAPVCAPSRSSIITGMYASSVGSHHMRSDVIPPAYVRCFSEYLRAGGYFCTNNAKTDYNFSVPVTAWDQNGKNAHWRNRDKDQPFFAVFNINQTHESQANRHRGRADLTDELSPAERHDPAEAKLPAYYPDTPAVRATWAHWYDCITVMDRRVDDLLREIEKEGLAESTIVFFWGDHGRGLPRGKRWLYDSGLRVPLLIRWPGKVQAGSVRTDLASLLDLGPTVLAMAGVKPPAHMQGRDLFGDQPPPKYLFATRDRMDETCDMLRSVRDERYHYLRNFQPQKPYAQPISYGERSPIMREWRRLAGEGKLSGAPALFFAAQKPVEELYDTAEDPDEVRNLANSPAHEERLTAMRVSLVEWMEQIDDQGLIPEPAGAPTTRPERQHPKCEPPVAMVQDRNVQLASRTAGASIAYRTDGRWRLYVEPIQLKAGQPLRAKACRAGFDESAEIRVGE